MNTPHPDTKGGALTGDMSAQAAGVTWFMVNHYGNKISPVIVSKSTEKTVSVVGRYGGTKPARCDKISRFEAYFPTWDEAHAYLMGRCEAKVHGCRRALELANSELGNAKGLKNPGATA